MQAGYLPIGLDSLDFKGFLLIFVSRSGFFPGGPSGQILTVPDLLSRVGGQIMARIPGRGRRRVNPNAAEKLPHQTWRGHVGAYCNTPLQRNLQNAKHHVPPAIRDFTLDEVLYDPFQVNQTRITRLWKCSRRVWQCNSRANLCPSRTLWDRICG